MIIYSSYIALYFVKIIFESFKGKLILPIDIGEGLYKPKF